VDDDPLPDDPVAVHYSRQRRKADDQRREELKARGERIRATLDAASGGPHYGYRPRWPVDPDDLTPRGGERRTETPESGHIGWSHSPASESWFLEARTPSAHDDYANFYIQTLARKAPAPKLWPKVA